MIKCYFVDVKSISSTIPKSKFKKAEIDRLADAILAADGLLRPLILQQTGVEKYTVVEGHREYYAAVRAKEKDIKKAEMVNAFIIDANLQKSAIEQLDLLTRSQPPSPIADPTPDPQIFTDLLAESIDRLLPTITAAISSQLQPIFAQLTEHQHILDAIKVALISKPTPDIINSHRDIEIIIPTIKVDRLEENVEVETKTISNSQETAKREENRVSPTSITVEPPKNPDLPEEKTVKIAKTTTRTSKKPKPEAIPSSPIAVVAKPAKQPATTATLMKKAKPAEVNQAAAIGSIDSDRSTNALNLINTLSQNDLMLRMERSGVAKTLIKLVPSIILQRTNQPAQKFDTWEELTNLKVPGLTPAKIQDIIKKLK
jgi:outer membrane biosynthesis protein TonB